MLAIAAGVALGVILALLVLAHWHYVVIAVVLLAMLALFAFLALPGFQAAVSGYMVAVSENPETAAVYAVTMAIVIAMAFLCYFWDGSSK